MPIFRDLASEINKDPLEKMSVEDLLQEGGYDAPKEEQKPQEVEINPEQVLQKASPESKSFLEKIFANASPEFAISPGGTTPIAGTPQEKAKPEGAKAAAQGITAIGETFAQLAYDTVDKFDDVANYFGITEEEMLKPYDIDWKSKLQSPDDNVGTQLVAKTIEYLAPGAGAAKLFKFGKLGAAGLNVAIDTFGMDPNQDRLANFITESAPELKEVAALGSILKYLEHNDKEGNWEGRLKNGIESLFINSLFLGAPGVFRAGQKTIEKGTEGAKKVANAFYSQLKNQNIIKTVDESLNASTKVVKETLPEVAETVTPMFKSPFLRKDSPHFGTLAARALDDVDVLVPRTTHEETIAKGKAILESEEVTSKLLSKNPAIEAYKPEEAFALREIADQTGKEIGEVAKRVDDMSTEEVAEFLSALTARRGLGVTSEGVARVSGQALESHKIEPVGITIAQKRASEAAKFQDQLLSEALAKAGKEGRKKFSEDLLKFMGGEENARKFIKDIANFTDDNIQRLKWIHKISQEGNLPKMGRALEFAMYNNMLGVGTMAKATFANAAATTVNFADSLTTAGVRSVTKTDTYRKFFNLPPLTNIEKMQDQLRLSASLRGYRDGMMNALGGLGRSMHLDRLGIALPTGENAYHTTKLDMGPKGLTQLEKFGILKDSDYTMKAFGHIMHNVGLRGISMKLLGLSDEFFGGLNYRAKLSELVADDLIRKNIPIDEFDTAYKKFMNDPPVELHQKAMDHAELTVAAKEIPEESILKRITENPVLKTLFPFARVGYNSIKYSFEHSPFRLTQFWSEAEGSLGHIIRNGTQLEKDEAIAKIIVGSTAMGTLAMLANSGEVNGALSPNWRIQQATAESGKGYLPYSINGVSFEAVDFMRPWFDIGQLLGEANKYMETGQYHDFVTYFTAGLLQYTTSNQLLENISTFTDIYSAASNGELTSADGLERWTAQFIGRFFPKLSREAAQVIEQGLNGEAYKRNLKETGESLKGISSFIAQVKNQLKSDIPFWNQDLPVTRNILGEPQLIPEGFGPDPVALFRTNSSKNTEIMEKLQILSNDTRSQPGETIEGTPGFRLQMPSKVVRIPATTSVFGIDDLPIGGNFAMSFELTPKQYDQYMQYYGNIHEGAQGNSLRKQLEIALADNSPIWKDLTKTQSEEDYRKALAKVSAIFTEARQRANYYIMQDKEFRKEYDKKLKVFEGEQKQFIRNQNAPTMLGQ